MNVYDFDKTIYNGNCAVDFMFFCKNKYPGVKRQMAKTLLYALLYTTGFNGVDHTASKLYHYLRRIPNIDQVVSEFWNKHQHKIHQWYLDQQQADDVIISASPYFLLKVGCDRIGIRHLITSNVDKYNGNLLSPHCYKAEKVKRFVEVFPDTPIDKFYSDSRTDTPLARLAKESYYVTKKVKLLPWFK